MQQIGYSLIDESGNEVKAIGDTKGQLFSFPEMIIFPNGDQVHCAKVGDQFGNIKIVERWLDDEQPTEYSVESGRTVAFDGTRTIVTVHYTEPQLSKEQLTAHAAKRRYEKEVAGITVAGVPVATDDRSKQMIIGARIAADSDPNFTTTWVGTNGNLYPMTAPQIIGVSNAVLAHVSSCFAIYANTQEAIAAGTISTPAEIDAAFA
jgi:hypothetical protein